MFNNEQEALNFWEDYTEQAESFALFDGYEYCQLAYFEELGELCGVFAKSVRGDGPVDSENVLKEIGDVLWNIAVGAKRAGSFALHEFLHTCVEQHYMTCSDSDLCIELMEESDSSSVLSVLEAIAKRHGGTLESCAEMNIAKLKSRKERGVIKGSGDNR